MSQTQQDSLENLRQRATCPVCRTFYVKPKKLSNCSHVFCLNCVTCHLRANSHLNFPKCPMCRKPMLKRLSEIDTYEPARAEEDIANFVRQFEICDVCNKPENPNLKCPNCNWYICENCVPCHGKLKPSHVVETIISSDRKVKGQSNSLKTCTKHPGQVADLFCIICLRVLCVHCRDYSHDECIETYGRSVVESVFTWRYFLQSYIQAQLELNDSTKGTELSINYTNKIKLLRIVQLKDIAKAAHNWLENIYEELKECIIFLREYKTQLNTVTCKINELEMPFKQIEFLQKRIDYAVAMGEDLYTQTERLLETPNDSDTVVYLLRNEERYPLLFQLKRKFQAEPKLLMAEICSTTRGNVVRKQVLSGSIQELDSVFIGLLVSRIIPTKVNRFCYFNELRGITLYTFMYDSTGQDDRNDENLLFEDISIFRAFVFTKNNSMSTQHCRENSILKLGKDFQIHETEAEVVHYNETKASYITLPRNDLIYTCSLLQQTEDMPRHEAYCIVHEISCGITYSREYSPGPRFCKERFCVQSPRRGKLGCIALSFFWLPMLLTHFVNIIVPPIVFYMLHNKLCVIIGNREDCGLETLLVYCQNTTRNTNNETYEAIYGVCIHTPRAKSYYSTGTKGETVSNCRIVNDKSGIFSLTLAQQPYPSTVQQLTYQTEMPETSRQADFLKCTGTKTVTERSCMTNVGPTVYCEYSLPVENIKPDFVEPTVKCEYSLSVENIKLDFVEPTVKCEYSVPVENIKLDFLYAFKDVFYFVSHESQTSLTVGKLTFTPDGMKSDTLFLIKQEDIDLPISQLKPLTMTETSTGEIITVCSVKDDNTKFVMIRPNKQDTSPIEFLEVSYPISAEISESTVEELEMSPQGDIVYVLKDKDGKSHSVLTKYLIEE